MASSDSILDEILEKGCTAETFCAVLSHAKENGRTSEVIRACLKALQVHPHHIPLRRLLAETCLDMGFLGRAEDEFITVGSYINELASVYMPLAELYLKQKRPQEACRALELYLAHYPDDEEARRLFENTRKVGDSLEVKEQEVMELAEALKAEMETEEHAINQDSLKEDLLLADSELDKEDLMEISTPTLAEIYFNQGQVQEAINIYEKVLMKYPEDKASMQRLTELKAGLRQHAEKKRERPETELTRRKEKMVSVLESWLDRLQET